MRGDARPLPGFSGGRDPGLTLVKGMRQPGLTVARSEPGGGRAMYQRIFAALDDSDGARRALDRAIDLARISGGTIDARYVVPDAPRLLDFDSGYADELEPSGRVSERAARVVADAEAALRRAGVRGTAQAIEAGGEDVSAVLVRAAIECNADLIVMGTHGRRGMRRFWLGSVAESLLRSARRPVLVVREARDR